MSPTTLCLRQELGQQLLATARAALPDECCGFILQGKQGQYLQAMRNSAAQKERAFAIAAQEQLELWRTARARQERIIGLYHSHPCAAAIPSRHDLAMAHEAQWHYLIITPDPRFLRAVRSFRIEDGRAQEEFLKFI